MANQCLSAVPVNTNSSGILASVVAIPLHGVVDLDNEADFGNI